MSKTKPADGLTSADIKKQIEEATKTEKAKTDIKDSGMPITGQLANEINATASTPEAKPITESKPQEVTPPAEQKPTNSNQVDFKEWARKKGIDWTTDTSILEALHKSDQEFHRKRAEERAKEVAQPPYNPPAYQPPQYVQPAGYPPAYAPQPAYQPQMPRNVVENVARAYNMTVEDTERLAAFNRDFFEAAMQQERARQAREMEALKKENQKNSVFRELSSDPVFRQPEVAIEFHNVLDQMQTRDPNSFEQDPGTYKKAYDQALVNIARRNLEGKSLQEGIPPVARMMTPPSIPPRPLGTGSAGGASELENEIDPTQFAKLSLEEKRRVLEKAGLRPAY